ncbi:MAG TPA: hydrolase 2, exosortase A system-associated, partial [Casimicrobiaceae bacterium]|nr:hydrolase 2, exosortase A system-associated [Casimicrobiaceae bacterium]
RVAGFEIVGGPGISISAALQSRVQAWHASGAAVDIRAIEGPAFWQTQELAECPDLISATVSAVESWRR